MSRGNALLWTGLVLAGGQSSRMGRDKASLPWNDGTLLDHARRQLLAAGAERVLTLGRTAGPETVADSTPAQGPLSALAQVAGQLPDGTYVVIPVDMPLLAPQALRLLAHTEGDCARWGDHPLPMRLRLDETVRARLQELDRAPPQARSLRALQMQLQTHVLDAQPWSAQLRGCNTPDEWRRLRIDARLEPSDTPDSH